MIAEITTLAGQYAGAGDDYRFSRDYLICAARHALDAEGCSGTSHIILVRAALGCAVMYAPAKDRGTAEEQINPLIAECESRMKGVH